MILQVPKGDYGILYTFTVMKKVNGVQSVRDLAGYSVKLKMWHPGLPGTLLINATCTVTDAIGGICTYTSTIADFTTIGEFNAELELTASGSVDSTMPFTIVVTESG
jgi:hypothetical protein